LDIQEHCHPLQKWSTNITDNSRSKKYNGLQCEKKTLGKFEAIKGLWTLAIVHECTIKAVLNHSNVHGKVFYSNKLEQEKLKHLIVSVKILKPTLNSPEGCSKQIDPMCSQPSVPMHTFVKVIIKGNKR